MHHLLTYKVSSYRPLTLHGDIPANTTHLNNVGVTLGQRRRRWPNVTPTLLQRVVICDAVPTLYQHCFNVSWLPGYDSGSTAAGTLRQNHGDLAVTSTAQSLSDEVRAGVDGFCRVFPSLLARTFISRNLPAVVHQDGDQALILRRAGVFRVGPVFCRGWDLVSRAGWDSIPLDKFGRPLVYAVAPIASRQMDIVFF